MPDPQQGPPSRRLASCTAAGKLSQLGASLPAGPRPWARAARPHRRPANLRPPRRESQREDQLVQAVMWSWSSEDENPPRSPGRGHWKGHQMSIAFHHSVPAQGGFPAPGPDSARLQRLLPRVSTALMPDSLSHPFLDVEPIG